MHGSASRWRNESALADFHELRPDLVQRTKAPLPFYGGTVHAKIFPHVHGVFVIAQVDDLLTFRATSRLELWRVLKFFEIIFVRAVIDVHFGLKVSAAFFTGFPVARMSFIKMVTAQCIAIVVSTTTVMGVGKQNVFMLVIANPLAATFGLDQVFCFAA